MSSSVITLLGRRELVDLLFFGLWFCNVYHGLFSLPLGVTGSPWSVIVNLWLFLNIFYTIFKRFVLREVYVIGSSYTLRKHAYSNILKSLPPKSENFQIKNSDIFHISAQNIGCGYSLEPPRFLRRNKKNDIYLCKPQFYCITVGFKGVKII